jgi:hypothetical protein
MLGVRTPTGSFELNDQGAVQIGWDFCANMFDASLPVGAEKIVPQAIEFCIYDFFKLGFQYSPLRGIDIRLENGVLDALPIVLADLRDSTEPSRPTGFGCIYIVGYKNHHWTVPYFQNQGG